jgi:hypothetical protein
MLPDFGGGDLSDEQRRVKLEQAINFIAPLAAMPIFLAVVAMEDFVRDLGGRMAADILLNTHFPMLANLGSQTPLANPAKRFSAS